MMFENCLGYDFRESGHSLLPEPPTKSIGIIDFIFLTFFCINVLLENI